jgi:Xaa-Pro aminopeptidase
MNDYDAIKSEAEIMRLETAAQVAGKGIQAGLDLAIPGIRLLEVERAARDACLQAGAEEIHEICLVSGKKIQSPTEPYDPEHKITDGGFLYLGVMGKASNFNFDLARIKVCGNASDEQIDFMEHLAEAAEWMVGNVKPDTKAVFYFTESRGRSIHAQAHGIGRCVCEEPEITLKKPLTPRIGWTLCIEPLVTCDQFGSIAIKEMFTFTKSGPRSLSGLPLRCW